MNSVFSYDIVITQLIFYVNNCLDNGEKGNDFMPEVNGLTDKKTYAYICKHYYYLHCNFAAADCFDNSAASDHSGFWNQCYDRAMADQCIFSCDGNDDAADGLSCYTNSDKKAVYCNDRDLCGGNWSLYVCSQFSGIVNRTDPAGMQ